MANVLIDQQLEPLDTEEHIVLRWRREEFSRLGFDPVDARLLAESPADLGQARSICGAGCPLHVAYRILT